MHFNEESLLEKPLIERGRKLKKLLTVSFQNRHGIEKVLQAATAQDFENRARFEIERALTNYKAGRATQTEINFLRRKGMNI